MKPFEDQGILPPEILTSPVKENNKMKEDAKEYFGTTSLRKTVFKNHYAEKIKEMGTEPSTVKGGVPSINPGSGGGPR